MNTKRKGSRAEHRAMKILESSGYSCTRAAASLGVFDVVAIGARDVRLIQVKSGDRCQISPTEREAIRTFVAPINVSREIWKFHDGVRSPIIERV
jgi:Holliday junction resolvase